jgi:GNAT superfamily N-acetyltransferase
VGTALELSITPVEPSDASALVDLFDRSSESTRRERFHGAVREVPPKYLDDVVHGVPGVVARVARDLATDPSGHCIVALATASLEESGRAELAVWVVDEWQRRGVGGRVVGAVVDVLRAGGISTAVAYVELDNHAAISLARRVARDLEVAVSTGPQITFYLNPGLGELTA